MKQAPTRAEDRLARRLARAATHVHERSSDFDLDPELRPRGRRLTPAAVLVPVRAGPRGGRLVLTRRASGLRHHAGQIALPGGRQDPADAGPEAAALREAREEIGLDPAQVAVLGRLPPHETVTGFLVTPVLGLVTAPFRPRPEPGEVEEVFDVPLGHVTDPARYRVEWRIWQGRRRHYWVVPWGPYYIWGATARILRGLAAGWEQATRWDPAEESEVAGSEAYR